MAMHRGKGVVGFWLGGVVGALATIVYTVHHRLGRTIDGSGDAMGRVMDVLFVAGCMAIVGGLLELIGRSVMTGVSRMCRRHRPN